VTKPRVRSRSHATRLRFLKMAFDGCDLHARVALVREAGAKWPSYDRALRNAAKNRAAAGQAQAQLFIAAETAKYAALFAQEQQQS
jgi:hypothetical protein